MLKVNLSPDDIAFLKEMQEELKTQNNRCTANPMYVIMETRRFTTDEYSYDGWRWIYDENSYESNEDLFENLYECDQEKLLFRMQKAGIISDWEEEASREEIEELFMDNIDDITDEMDIRKWHYQNINQIAEGSCFSFFEKDSYEHLDMNEHNLLNPKSYAASMFRTPRMERLRNILLNLEFEGE